MKQQNQAEWVDAALRRYESPLLRYARSFTGDTELARDVVQDAFLKLCEADRDKVDGHLAPWLYTVVRNRALTLRKKEARMIPLLEGQAEALSDGKATPRGDAAKRETHGRIAAVLHELPERQQEACRLKFQNELTYREISQIMDLSLGTVSNLITSALTAIREQLMTQADAGQEV